MNVKRDEEFIRRLKLLGLEGCKVVDIGGNGKFYPVDPEAEALHPDWKRTCNYGGGAYSPDGHFHADCKEQYCMAPCGCCECNLDVLIYGRKGLKYVPNESGDVNPDFQDHTRAPMVFDWDEAARRIKESGCVTACAGLRGHQETFRPIFRNGRPVVSGLDISSPWAVPVIEINGVVTPCYKWHEGDYHPMYVKPQWWPAAALDILGVEH